jgi:hypothetical protein
MEPKKDYAEASFKKDSCSGRFFGLKWLKRLKNTQKH